MNFLRISCLKKAVGSSLIEVLIALFVLAIGMLGVLAMQVNAVRASKSAELHSQSQILALAIYESMKATPLEYIDNYELGLGVLKAQPNCSQLSSECSNAEIISWNLHDWQTTIAASLPQGRGGISKENNEYLIRVEFSSGYSEDSSGVASNNKFLHELVAVF